MCDEGRIVICYHIKQDHFSFSFVKLYTVSISHFQSRRFWTGFIVTVIFKQRQYCTLSYRSRIHTPYELLQVWEWGGKHAEKRGICL